MSADDSGAPRMAGLPKAELIALLARARADSGLRDDLAALDCDSTDDLGPIE